MAKKDPKDNLIPTTERTPEERREMGRKGGLKAAANRREKINFKKELYEHLQLKLPRNDTDYDFLKKKLGREPIVKDKVISNLTENKSVDAYREIINEVGASDEEARLFELPATVIGKDFVDLNREIEPNKAYCLEGGRGSLKSSFLSEKVIELICQNPLMHACVVRKQTNTLRDSVYTQIKWAIDILGLTDDFEATVSPLEITYKPTGQKIYFRGCDKPEKLKSIKPPFGYIGILWIEELDQLNGLEEKRSIKQSILRGGEISYDFASYNPPISKAHWVNVDSEFNTDKNTIYHKSNYKNAPKAWLGAKFLQEAEHLKETNEKAYLHEYEGVPIGIGTNVFENVEVREITDEEIATFDYIYMGLDWGYNPDPLAWTKSAYVDETVYLFDELVKNKMSNKQLFEALTEDKQVRAMDLITADNSNNKDNADLKTYGLNVRSVQKWPGSVDAGVKWLQTRKKIVIDPKRCPNSAKEFVNYQYELTKDGEPISAYPDKNNHTIDSLRYGLQRVWKKRGN